MWYSTRATASTSPTEREIKTAPVEGSTWIGGAGGDSAMDDRDAERDKDEPH